LRISECGLIFRIPQSAIRNSLWWLGKIYAHHGYFTEAVEALEQMAALASLSPDAHRLYGEARWWRDNDHYICWAL
jgi:cytochrome c-type biogenesis protein CcmH/NrfG